MTQKIRGTPVDGWLARLPGANGLARSLAVLGLVASSAGCILTQDIPDPALDVPGGYKAARLRRRATHRRRWTGGAAFRSRELTQLMEEAQTVNLDIAAAVARFVQADAQARIAGAALLPSLSGSGQESYGRTSGSSASGLTNRRPRDRQLFGLAQRQLPARFLGRRIVTRRRRPKRPRWPTASTAMWWR